LQAVRELARRLGIPKEILEKPPSAGLWQGQMDEGEIGITYDVLDQVLFGLETGLSPERIAKEVGCDIETVSKVQGMIRKSVPNLLKDTLLWKTKEILPLQ